MEGKFSKADERWRKLNKKAIEASSGGDWFSAGTTYYEMARQLEGEDKDNSRERRLGYEMKLRHSRSELENYRKSGVKKIEVLATPESCKHCLKLDGKTFSVAKALKNPPVPVEECDQELGYGCRCTYLPV